jgi:hypothetical protein
MRFTDGAVAFDPRLEIFLAMVQAESHGGGELITVHNKEAVLWDCFKPA